MHNQVSKQLGNDEITSDETVGYQIRIGSYRRYITKELNILGGNNEDRLRMGRKHQYRRNDICEYLPAGRDHY